MIILNRRAWMAGAAATVLMPPMARAQQSKQIVVGTWGGDYGDLMKDFIDTPILKPAGYEVVQDLSAPTPRRTKVLAERQNRRGSYDVACLSDFDMFAVSGQDALEKITSENVTRSKYVLPFLQKPNSIPNLYSAHTIVYNTDKIKTPPTSIHDLWDPKYRGKVGFSDFLFTTVFAFAAMAGGGSMSDFGPAQKKLRELKELGAKVYASNEAMVGSLKSEDTWLTIIAAARGFMWKQSGIPLGHVIPQEGAFPSVYEAAVPKNARNKDGGFVYLNAMLDPEAQKSFGSKFGYLPTVSDAKLDPEIDRQINFTEAERSRLWKPDFGYMASQQSMMFDFWNKEFKA